MSKESPEAKLITLQQPASNLEAALKVTVVVLAGLAIFFFGQLIPALLIVTALGLSGRDTDAINSLLQDNIGVQVITTVLTAICTIFIIWKVLRWRGHDPKSFLMLDRLPSWGQVGEIVLTYGVYFVTLVVASILVGALTSVDVNQSQELGVADTAGSGLAAVFVMLVVVPPILEELLFRGFLYRYLHGFGGVVVGYVLTSLIFGAAHLEFGNLNWIAAIDTLIFSGFLIYISQKHQSLYSAMIMHAMKNGIAFYVLFIA